MNCQCEFSRVATQDLHWLPLSPAVAPASSVYDMTHLKILRRCMSNLRLCKLSTFIANICIVLRFKGKRSLAVWVPLSKVFARFLYLDDIGIERVDFWVKI